MPAPQVRCTRCKKVEAIRREEGAVPDMPPQWGVVSRYTRGSGTGNALLCGDCLQLLAMFMDAGSYFLLLNSPTHSAFATAPAEQETQAANVAAEMWEHVTAQWVKAGALVKAREEAGDASE